MSEGLVRLEKSNERDESVEEKTKVERVEEISRSSTLSRAGRYLAGDQI